MKTEATIITLDEWTLAGGGWQGESYFHKTNPQLLLKLFAPDSENSARLEYNATKAIQNTGVPCTKIYDLVKVGDRYGIIYQRVQNKKSFCRAIADDPSCLEEMAERFAKMAKELHATRNDGVSFTNSLDFYADVLSKTPKIEPSLRKEFEQLIAQMRENNPGTLVHGDFHFGNVITDGKKDYFIDLGSFAYGHPDIDHSMLYFVCMMLPEEDLLREYHIHKPEAQRFWKQYKRFYFGDNAPSDSDLLKEYKPYLMLRTIFFDFADSPEDAVNGVREFLRKL